MASLGVNDAELGRRLRLSRQAVHAKRTGRTVMTLDDLADVAQALDVEPGLFLGRPSQALAWLAEHRADQLDGGGPDGELGRMPPPSRCTGPLDSKGQADPSVLNHPLCDGRLRPMAWAA